MNVKPAIIKCRKPSISKRFSAWMGNREEIKLQKKIDAFSNKDFVEWRRNRGWTQPDCAEWLGFSLRYIQKIELREIDVPKWMARLLILDQKGERS